MQALEHAILRTVIYGEVFSFAMTVEEIHHFLIFHEAVDFKTVSDALVSSPMLVDCLMCDRGYVARKSRPELIDLRLQREAIAAQLWSKALNCGVWLSRLPFVRLVALTGALAMRNPSHVHDDLDYFLVTQSGRVWMARAFAVLLVRVFKLRGVVICPNFVLAEDALAQARQDLYTAHEVTQVVTVYDDADLYTRFRCENNWIFAHLPNALGEFNRAHTNTPSPRWQKLKKGLEWMLGGRIGDVFEAWERQRKIKRLNQSHTPAAQLDHSQVKGHFNDHGARVLARYQALLHESGIDSE